MRYESPNITRSSRVPLVIQTISEHGKAGQCAFDSSQLYTEGAYEVDE